ncbi:MAG TPA: hypothetical protein VFU27_13345 [Terriglobales bacterium]|nr:hypothetical protein [Terriglobales bacterium]
MKTMATWKLPYHSPALAVHVILRALVFVIALAAATSLFAQTDEIQVYDAEIEAPGIFNLMIHSNFTPLGRTTPAFPGAIIADHSFNGTAEWAYGVTPWFEQGLYLPVYTIYSSNQGAVINGFKLRELFVRPNAHDHKLFYGVNFEFSVNARYWEDRRISSEVRPIVGLHLHRWDLIYNPIVDTAYTGGLGGLEYNPGGRIAYNLNDKWALALEEYDGFGPLHEFVPVDQQFHEVWAVMDHASSKLLGINVEAGIGFGLTAGADKVTLKLMLSRNLNAHKWRP